MPLPTKTKGEKQSDFVSRCMSSETMKKEFPDHDQRLAVCFKQFRSNEAMPENMVALAAQVAETRTEKFMDRDHLVVPVVALLEQVLTPANSGVPALALAEEFGKLPNAWNGRPVVINHPELNGQKVSANLPNVLETEEIGKIFNSKLEDNKLKMEAWIDLERVEALGGTIEDTVKRLQSGEMVEVSTGLFADSEKTVGEFKDKKYKEIWRNIVPDHLAILSDAVGACSIADGCGAPRVNEDGSPCDCVECTKARMLEAEKDSDERNIFSLVLEKLGLVDNRKHSDRDRRTMLQAGLASKFGSDAWVEAVYDNTIVYSTYGGYFEVDYSMDGGGSVTFGKKSTPVVPQVSYSPMKVNKEIEDNAGKTKSEGSKNFPASDYAYVPDPSKPSTWKLRLTKTPGGGPDAGIVGAAIAALGKGFRGNKVQIPAKDLPAVKSKVRAAWKKANPGKESSEMPEVIRNSSFVREEPMDKEKFVAELIANSGNKFAEGDKDWLLGLEDEQLEKMASLTEPGEPESTDEPTDNSAKPEGAKKEETPTDPKKFLEAAPKEVQEFVNEGLRLQEEKRSALIKGILANSKNTFTEDELKGMDTKTLERFGAIAIQEDYSGRGGPREPVTSESAPPKMPQVFENKSAA